MLSKALFNKYTVNLMPLEPMYTLSTKQEYAMLLSQTLLRYKRHWLTYQALKPSIGAYCFTVLVHNLSVFWLLSSVGQSISWQCIVSKNNSNRLFHFSKIFYSVWIQVEGNKRGLFYRTWGWSVFSWSTLLLDKDMQVKSVLQQKSKAECPVRERALDHSCTERLHPTTF